ncbi:MAG: lactonase family protein [Acidimicrobiales bacterium]|nr:lactonase family protein [Acidimicrobiales bacterium]
MAHGEAVSRRIFLYAGSYTHQSSVGIRIYDATDPEGFLIETGQVTDIEHPSFLAVHPNGQVLYAVSETASEGGGGLVAFRIDPLDGSLSVIDRTTSQGAAPCYVSLDAHGRYVYIANYVSGSIAVYSLESDGRFGELVAVHKHVGTGPSQRQDRPHAHCVIADPGGDTVYAVDLGADRIFRYGHIQSGTEKGLVLRDSLSLDPGSGPRHLVFHPDQPVAFLVCELESTVSTFGVDSATGELNRLQTLSTLPPDFAGESIGAEVRVHPDGRHVYVSNRGHDSIAVFRFHGFGEPLESLGHVPSAGHTPRSFAVHPFGRSLIVANQDSDTIVPFTIEAHSGIPQQHGVSSAASQPVFLTFVEMEP